VVRKDDGALREGVVILFVWRMVVFVSRLDGSRI